MESEKRGLSNQLLLQQREIQRLQTSLNKEAERVKAFEHLEESHRSPSQSEQMKREAEQR